MGDFYYKKGAITMKAYLRVRKTAATYYCLLKYQEGGKQRSKEISTGIPIKGNNKRKAEKKCEEIRQQYEKMFETNKIDVSDVLFIDYLQEWLDSQKRLLKPSTYYGYSMIMKNHIIPFFKPKKLKLIDVTPKHIQDYYNFMLDSGLNPSTVKRHHANIRKALQNAMELNMIPYNAADRTKLPKSKPYHANIYDEQQLMTLLTMAENTPIESVLMLCVYYGLRRGEVAGLLWEAVNLDDRELYIKNTRTTAKGEIFQDTTKTLSSCRTLPIEQEMYDYLTSLKLKQEKNKKILGEAYCDSGFVCCWDNGEPLKVSYISHAFSDLLKRNDLPHIRFHDIRHSTATALLRSGVNLKVIQEILGHSTMSTTANFYLHPDIEEKRKAVNVMSGVFKKVVVK